MEKVFQDALMALWREGSGGMHVYILRRPDGSYFHSIEWDYLPYPYKTFEEYFAEKFPGCMIDYVGGVPAQHAGGGTRGFEGFVNDWTKEPVYRIQENSYEFAYEEPLTISS